MYSMNSDSEFHQRARQWWESAQTGSEHIGLTWPVMIAYLRLMTNPRIMPQPLTITEAVDDVHAWMQLPRTVMLYPGPDHVHILHSLLMAAGRGGDLTSDAHVAALALEHGGTVYSQDADFARFPGVRWIDPLRNIIT